MSEFGPSPAEAATAELQAEKAGAEPTQINPAREQLRFLEDESGVYVWREQPETGELERVNLEDALDEPWRTAVEAMRAEGKTEWLEPYPAADRDGKAAWIHIEISLDDQGGFVLEQRLSFSEAGSADNEFSTQIRPAEGGYERYDPITDTWKAYEDGLEGELLAAYEAMIATGETQLRIPCPDRDEPGLIAYERIRFLDGEAVFDYEFEPIELEEDGEAYLEPLPSLDLLDLPLPEWDETPPDEVAPIIVVAPEPAPAITTESIPTPLSASPEVIAADQLDKPPAELPATPVWEASPEPLTATPAATPLNQSQTEPLTAIAPRAIGPAAEISTVSVAAAPAEVPWDMMAQASASEPVYESAPDQIHTQMTAPPITMTPSLELAQPSQEAMAAVTTSSATKPDSNTDPATPEAIAGSKLNPEPMASEPAPILIPPPATEVVPGFTAVAAEARSSEIPTPRRPAMAQPRPAGPTRPDGGRQAAITTEAAPPSRQDASAPELLSPSNTVRHTVEASSSRVMIEQRSVAPQGRSELQVGHTANVRLETRPEPQAEPKTTVTRTARQLATPGATQPHRETATTGHTETITIDQIIHDQLPMATEITGAMTTEAVSAPTDTVIDPEQQIEVAEAAAPPIARSQTAPALSASTPSPTATATAATQTQIQIQAQTQPQAQSISAPAHQIQRPVEAVGIPADPLPTVANDHEPAAPTATKPPIAGQTSSTLMSEPGSAVVRAHFSSYAANLSPTSSDEDTDADAIVIDFTTGARRTAARQRFTRTTAA